LVVPCFNEAKRLDAEELLRLSRSGGPAHRITLLFVNDGSTDATLDRLRQMQGRHPERIDVLELASNHGKGDAVRLGLLRALDADAEIVGYLDADLSVPVDGILELLDVLRASTAEVVLGARVTMLGRDIQRNAMRHYLGRVFASAASLALGARVYDTQCGGKLFRASPALAAALGQPFISRWVFDVELLGRLLAGEAPNRLDVKDIVEYPLRVWREKPGSKLTLTSMVRAVTDLGWIALDLARRRR
jgi:glycosyltransferase involved in cell wall biosynthesis